MHCWWRGQYTHLLKGKHTDKHAIYQEFAIVLKTNVFGAVLQQLPDSNAAEMNTQEHCQPSAAKHIRSGVALVSHNFVTI
jgi:hypothetical protein